MKIKIGDKRYEPISLERLTLTLRIRMPRDTGMTLDEVMELNKRVMAMTKEERASSEEAVLFTGFAVWAARSAAGERLTLEEACDFPFTDLGFELEPGDEEIDEEPDPQSAPKAASARGSAKAPADRLKKRTSKKASSAV